MPKEGRNHLATFKCAKRMVKTAGVIQNKKNIRAFMFTYHFWRASHWGCAKHMARRMSLLFSFGTEISYSRHTIAFCAYNERHKVSIAFIYDLT